MKPNHKIKELQSEIEYQRERRCLEQAQFQREISRLNSLLRYGHHDCTGPRTVIHTISNDYGLSTTVILCTIVICLTIYFT